MISRIWVAALAAVLLVPCSQASASFIIDDFNAAGTGSGAGITGNTGSNRLSLTNIGVGGDASISGGVVTRTVGADGRGFALDYAISGSPPSPGGFGYHHFLELTGLSVFGNWQVTFKMTGIDPNDGFSITPTAISQGVTSAVVDLAGNNTHPGNLNGLTGLTLTFLAVSDPDAFGRTLTMSSMAAVPEPTSLALFGVSCLGGLGLVVRRRRKKTA